MWPSVRDSVRTGAQLVNNEDDMTWVRKSTYHQHCLCFILLESRTDAYELLHMVRVNACVSSFAECYYNENIQLHNVEIKRERSCHQHAGSARKIAVKSMT